MLDQPDYIARYDTQDALGVIKSLPLQLAYEFEMPLGLKDIGEVRNIVLTGMGGSAQSGEFLKTWLGRTLGVPFVIVRNYDLPAFVGPDTLVIADSYSGNTEETVSALHEATKSGAKVVVIASGGKLIEAAKVAKQPHIELPGGLQPRFAVFYAVRALTLVLETVGLLKHVSGELEAAGKWLAHELGAWDAGVPTPENPAKQLAEALVGHPVVVYAGPTLAFAAMKLKIAINENAKNISFYNYLPEFDHNEFIGWQFPASSGIKVVELRSDLDQPHVIKRFDISNRLLSSAFHPLEVHAGGETPLQQLVWTIGLGEYVATYLACLNKIDPTPVRLVEELKKEL